MIVKAAPPQDIPAVLHRRHSGRPLTGSVTIPQKPTGTAAGAPGILPVRISPAVAATVLLWPSPAARTTVTGPSSDAASKAPPSPRAAVSAPLAQGPGPQAHYSVRAGCCRARRRGLVGAAGREQQILDRR